MLSDLKEFGFGLLDMSSLDLKSGLGFLNISSLDLKSLDFFKALGVGVLGAFLAGRLVVLLVKPSPGGPLPPGPKKAPLIGNLHQMPKILPWFHLYHWSRDLYGPVMHMNMGGQSLVILSSHQAAHDLLNRQSAQYSHRPRMVMLGELVTKGMHTLIRPYDERYRLHKRMEAPLLNMHSAASYRPLQEAESQQLLFDVLGEWDEYGEKGVDFHHHFERAMASTIYCLNYGYRLKTGYEKPLMDGKEVQASANRTGQPGAYIVDSFPLLNYLPRFLAPWKSEAEGLFELERQLHVGNLEKALASKGWNLSKSMSKSTEARDMGTEELAFDLGILSNAALDTSTVALDWFIIAWITTGGSWVKEAQALLDKVVGKDRVPTFEDRPKLAFIDAIVNETLRWRPVGAGGVPHFTRVEDTYMGYRIPANSIVLPNFFSITRDESVFGPDPNNFEPYRWLADDPPAASPIVDACGMNVSALKPLPQTGFGYGRRACTGKIIARNSLFIQVARMLWAFEVESGVVGEKGERHVVNDMDCIEGIVVTPKTFKAVMRPRGQWVTEVIRDAGTTHGIDHSEMLDKASRERA